MNITNKSLLEHKKDRFVIYSFDNEGKRSCSHGNINIIDVAEEVKKYTQKGIDVLLFDYNEDDKKSIRVITQLESSLKRRATKQEIIEFYKKVEGEV